LLVIAGHVTIDDTVLPDGRTVMGAIGGDALYTALGAAIWSADVALLSRVGEDFPKNHLERLRAAGLDTTGLIVYPVSSIHYWVLYEWDGRRHFIVRNPSDPTPTLSPEPDDIPPAYATTTRAFHAAAMPLGNVERLLHAAAALPGAPLLTLDTHEDFVDGYQARLSRLLPLLASFLPSREEVALWFGDDDPERHIGDLLALGPRMVAIKMGADGVLFQTQGQSRPRHIPIVPVTACDVTGAGDGFCGGLLAQLARGAAPLDAVMAGVVSASFAVENFGIEGLLQASVRDRDERLALLRQSMRECEDGH
jgi:ribokinase